MARGHTSGPLRRVVVSGLTVLSMLLVGVPGATAHVALRLTVDSEAQITAVHPDGSGVAEGVYTAVGPASTTGTACPSGTVRRHEFAAVTDELGPRIVRAIETYSCGDGSGSFTARFVGRRTAVDGPLLTFAATIVITDGTGVYSDLRARGVGTAVADLATGALRTTYDLDVRSAA